MKDLLASLKNHRRIVVVGTTGSGKTSLSRRWGRELGLPVIELDALHWGPDWTPVAGDVFQKRVADAIAAPEWIIDGNFSVVRDQVWKKAQAVVWLDYSFPRVFSQLLLRTLRRSFNRQVLRSGNRERLFTSFFSRESILLWAIKTYPEKKRSYPRLFREPAYQHLKVYRITEAELANSANSTTLALNRRPPTRSRIPVLQIGRKALGFLQRFLGKKKRKRVAH